MNILRKINQVSQTFSKWFAVAFLGLMTISVSYQVLSRYVDTVPRILWTEELSRAGLIWLVFLGAAFAFYEREHFRVELLSPRLGPKVLGNIEIVTQLLTFITLFIVLIGAVIFFLAGFGRTSTMSGVSLAWSYLAMPVSFSIMLSRSIEDLLDAIRHRTLGDSGEKLGGV